jgi:hypothetical protein
MNFKEALAVGKTGETRVARWLMTQGRSILPIYEIAENQYKGPTFYCESEPDGLIAPDMLVIGPYSKAWVEVKTKTAFSWHRNTERFVTGIDFKHYSHYLKIAQLTGWPVWLFFLHSSGGIAKDTPPDMASPAGLFGGNILRLELCENHRHDGWGTSGMVYWAVENLEKIAGIKQFEGNLC